MRGNLCSCMSYCMLFVFCLLRCVCYCCVLCWDVCGMLRPGQSKADWSVHLEEQSMEDRTVELQFTELLCLLHAFFWRAPIFVCLSLLIQPSPPRHHQKEVLSFSPSFPSQISLSSSLTHWLHLGHLWEEDKWNNSAAIGALAHAVRERKIKGERRRGRWVTGGFGVLGTGEKGGLKR